MLIRQIATTKAVYNFKFSSITLVKLNTDDMTVDVYTVGNYAFEFRPEDFGTSSDLKDRNGLYIGACVMVGLRYDSAEMWLDLWYSKEKAKIRLTYPKTYLAGPDTDLVEYCECEVCDQAGYGAGRGSKAGHVYDCICGTCVAWREMQASVFNGRPAATSPAPGPAGERGSGHDYACLCDTCVPLPF